MINNKKGLTLLEVLAVIVILGILATVSYTLFSDSFKDTDLASRQLQAKSMTDIVSEYIQMNNGKAPTVSDNPDYLAKPALIDKSKVQDSIDGKIEGNYYIYGANNEIYYDYPPAYIASLYQKYQKDKGTYPVVQGTSYIDVKLLYTAGYLENAPLTSYTITPEGDIEQIALKQEINDSVSNNGKDKPTKPIIIPSKASPYYTNDTINFSATSYYEKGDVTFTWTVDSQVLSAGQDINAYTKGRFTVGTHTIKVKATASDGKVSDETTFTLVVNGENKPPTKPVITVSPNKSSYTSNDVITFTAVSTDPEGEAITYKWLGTTTNNKYPRGVNEISVYAIDSNGNISEKTSVNITILNSAPVIKSVTNSANPIYLDTILNFTPVIEDPDGDLTQYEIIGQTSTKTYSIGSHTIQIIAKDTLGAVSTTYNHTFVVANRPPTKPTIAMSPTTNLRPESVITFTASGSTDPDNQTVTYEWQNKATTYPFGTHTVQVRAVDTLGATSAWASITFTIANNAPSVPTLTMSPSASSDIRTNTNITFTASGSVDPDGDTFTYEYDNKLTNYPIGSNTVKVRAVDKYGSASAWASITFTVNNSAPTTPTITMSPTTSIKANTTITWNASGSTDVDGDTITYEWVNKQSTYPKGSNTVQVRAKDSRGAYSAYASITFTVENTAPTQPTISYSPTSNIKSNTAITFSRSTSTDVDGDTITYEWKVDSGSYSTTVPNGTFSVGSHTVYLRAKDSAGAYSTESSATFTVANTAPNQPSIYMSPTGTIFTWTTVSFSAAATDIDNQTLTYYWQVDGGGWTTTVPNGTFGSGNHTVAVKVNDGYVDSATNSVTFSVQNPIPATPTGLTCTPGGTTASCSFNASSYATTYQVCTTTGYCNEGSSTNITVTGLYPNIEYDIYVRAGNLGGWSNFSSTVHIKTAAPNYKAPEWIPYSWEGGYYSLDAINECDDCATSLSIPFNINFYGNDYNFIYVSSNALITIGASNNVWTNVPMADGSTPLNALAVFWDDLRTDIGADGVYYQFYNYGTNNPNNHVTIEWRNVNLYRSTGCFGTFEAKLYADGRVQYDYQNVYFCGETATSATGGIKATDGRVSEIFYNQAIGYPSSVIFNPQ